MTCGREQQRRRDCQRAELSLRILHRGRLLSEIVLFLL